MAVKKSQFERTAFDISSARALRGQTFYHFHCRWTGVLAFAAIALIAASSFTQPVSAQITGNLEPKADTNTDTSPDGENPDHENPDHEKSIREERQLQSRVDDLLRELNSASFSRRQVAAEQLWRLGPDATEILKSRLEFVEPETALRIRNILTAFELGLDSETPQSVATLILHFHDGESSVREQVACDLSARGKYRILLDLIASIKLHDDRKSLYNAAFELDEAVASMAIESKWTEIEELIEHPLCREFDLAFVAFHARVNGTFDSLTSEFRNRVDIQSARLNPMIERLDEENPAGNDGETDHPAGENSDRKSSGETTAHLPPDEDELAAWQRDVDNLIKLFRVASQHDLGIEYAAKISDDAKRHATIRRIECEAGRWDLVAERTVIADPIIRPADGQLVVSPVQKALVHFFADQQEPFDAVLADLNRAASAPPDPLHDRNPRTDLINLHFAMLRLDEAEKHFGEFEFDDEYKLYSRLGRYRDALESIGLSDDFDERVLWFERRTVQMQSILNQYERTGNNKFSERAEAVFTQSVEVASRMGMSGFRDEAQLHLLSLLNEVDNTESLARRNQILTALVRLGFYDQAREMIENRYRPDDLAYTLSPLFDRRVSQAAFWNNQLTKICPDPLTRLKLVARLIDSPLKVENEPLDVQSVLTLLTDTDSLPARKAGPFHEQVAALWLIRGDREQHSASLEKTANFAGGSSLNLGRIHFLNGDYLKAAEQFDSIWQSSQSPLTTARAARALELAGDAEGAARRRTALFAFWLKNYRRTRVIQSFRSADRTHWLREVLNVSIPFRVDSNIAPFREALAESTWREEPSIAINQWNLVLFNSANLSSEWPDIGIVETARIRAITCGLQLIETGRRDEAITVLEQCLEMMPGDAEFGELVIPALDAMGETEIANLMFNRLASEYSTLLATWPDSATHHNNYAWICASCNRRLEFVMYHAELAVQLEPHNPGFLDTLALAHFCSGDHESAANLSARCLQLNPGSQNYLENFYRYGGRIELRD